MTGFRAGDADRRINLKLAKMFRRQPGGDRGGWTVHKLIDHRMEMRRLLSGQRMGPPLAALPGIAEGAARILRPVMRGDLLFMLRCKKFSCKQVGPIYSPLSNRTGVRPVRL
jgi:hypothetical protein